jgi:hypothetical protein
MINEKYKFAFIHIPKCAGSSIEKIFLGKTENLPHVFGYTHKVERPDLYRWTCLRNTWDRLVSVYFYSIVRKNVYSLNLDISFEEFIMRYIDENGDKYAYIDENRFFGRDGHMIYITDHKTKKLLINFYVNMWNLKEHLEILFKHLNIDLKLIKNIEKKNSTIHDDYRKYYINNKMIEAVAKRYKFEIDTLGFVFDNPNKFKEDLVGINLNVL